ncbi:MAG: translocation/assembly module TamB, partial [Rhodothermia bacterium]|nr:translocation/assembly module TamB [Rhodothermia bacterium]
LETPRGRLSAAADATPFDELPSYRFTDGTFENIDVGAFAGRDRIDTRLNGTFSLSLQGIDPETLTADGLFELSPSRVNSEEIDAGRLSIAADSGRFATNATFQLGEASLDLSGTTDLKDEEPFEVRGSINSLNVAGLMGADSLDSRVSATFYAAGTGLRDQGRTGQGRLAITSSNYQDIVVESVVANLSIDGKLLRVDTLTARSNVATLTGSGLVALSSDPDLPESNLEVEAALIDLRPLHSVVPPAARMFAGGVVSLSFSGEPDDVRFRADAQLNRISYGNLRIGEVDARVVGSLDENRQVAAAESRVEISQLSLPTVTARTTRFEAAYADDTVRYEATSTLDDRREIRTTGAVDLGGESTDLTISTLRVVLQQERWELLQPSTITFGDEYRIQNFLLYSETQQIAVDGYIDLDGEQSLILTIEQFRIGSVADFFDYKGLNGTLNGYMDLTGPAQAPIVTGSLTADILSSGKPVGDLSADLSYADLRLDIDGRLRNENGSALTIEGHLPVDLRLSALEDDAAGVGVSTAAAGGESKLTVKSDAFAIDWILPFLDPELFSSIGGVLTGQMDVAGTFSEPELSGEAVLTEGWVGLTEFGVRFTDLRGDFGFTDNRIEVNHLEARSGEGSAIVTGSITLSELTLGSFDLDISSEDFLAVDNREYRASAASDLTLSGSTRQPVLNGSVNVASADLFLAEEIEEFAAVRLSMEDLQTVEQRFGIRISEKDTTTFSFYEALAMDLTVQLSRNTWLRSKKSPEMDVQFTGDLEVRKERKQFAQVFGTIEVIPERSRIVQFGKTFSITKGTLTYNGPIDDPILDIEAEYEIRAFRNPENQVTITLSANGRFDDLDVELSSDPTMEMTDIVSYIAFGRPASESLHLGGSGAGGSLATNLALGQIAGLIEDVAGTGLGLDVIEIEQQGLDARLTAGKYVHRRVYLAISQPLNLSSSSSSTVSSTPEITAEFEMLQSLLLRVLSRRSSISVNLLWQYAY